MGLKWSDVNLDAGTAAVATTKNGTPFTFVIMPSVIVELKCFIKNKAGSDELVFGGDNPFKPFNFNKAWATALKDSKLVDTQVVFHTLRHTHASWLAQRGAPLLAIADSMNHKSLAMTQRYAHLCVDSRREMIAKLIAL